MSHGSSAVESFPFSDADMSDAFRKALRKPDFGDHLVEEGDFAQVPSSHGRPTAEISGSQIISVVRTTTGDLPKLK